MKDERRYRFGKLVDDKYQFLLLFKI